MKRVKTTDCQAELRRLLAKGPPIFLEDKHGLPLQDGETHVGKLWFASSGVEERAVLEGAVEGEEREILWEELRSFLVEKKEGEVDSDEEGKAESKA